MRGELAANQARPHVVRPAEAMPCVAATATLRDVVMSWLHLAQATKLQSPIIQPQFRHVSHPCHRQNWYVAHRRMKNRHHSAGPSQDTPNTRMVDN